MKIGVLGFKNIFLFDVFEKITATEVSKATKNSCERLSF